MRALERRIDGTSSMSPSMEKNVRVFENLSELAACAGQDIAISDWVTITQQHIQQFADATGDQQWIHTDLQRASHGPFGTPIAHGFLTLSLLPQFFERALQIQDVRMGVNYGLNKVRFITPVAVNSHLRGHLHLRSAEPIEQSGFQSVWTVTVEIQGHSKPACVGEFVMRQYPEYVNFGSSDSHVDPR